MVVTYYWHRSSRQPVWRLPTGASVVKSTTKKKGGKEKKKAGMEVSAAPVQLLLAMHLRFSPHCCTWNLKFS